MTRPRRGGWRWWGKWVAVATTVLLAAVWLASGWWIVRWHWGSAKDMSEIEVWRGVLVAVTMDVADPSADGPWPGKIYLWRISIMLDGTASYPPRVPEWRFRFQRHAYPRLHDIVIPLWAPASATLLASLLLFRLDRRPPPNSCPHCHYDLSATPPSAPCPECGRARPQPKEKAEEAQTSSA